MVNVPAGIKAVSMFKGPRPMFTVLVKVQVCPPILIAKLAVPLVAGVPVIVYDKLPAPLAKLPAAKVAVKPVTPVDVTVCPL
jgi:1-acyl-sn-glycerol-3-phosphate acyltransferase